MRMNRIGMSSPRRTFTRLKDQDHAPKVPGRPVQLLKMAFVLAWVACNLSAWSQAIPNYASGDLIVEDVITTVPLAVTDYRRTEQLRREKAALLPPIYRFQSRAAIESELALQQAFAAMRSRFGDGLEIAAKRRQLDARTVEHPSFERFVQWFEAQNPRFPITRELARLWAMEEPDDRVQAVWAGLLNQVMARCIHPDTVSTDMASSLAHVRIVPVESAEEILTAKAVANRGVDVMRTNLIALAQAKAQVAANAAQRDSVSSLLGAYLAGFVTLNCLPEAALARQIRDEATSDLWAVDHYQVGDVLAKRGQLVDARTKIALDLLRSKQAAAHRDTPKAAAAPSSSPRWAWAYLWNRWVGDPLQLEAIARSSLWALAGLSLVAVVALGVLVKRKRMPRGLAAPALNRQDDYTVVFNPQRNETIFLPHPKPAGQAPAPTGSNIASSAEGTSELQAVSEVSLAADQFWQQRALEAERRAEEIFRMVRAGLAPQLARQMMSKLVQELITQRAHWLKTQQILEKDLTEIERRFSRSHFLLLERLSAFEKRTEELEKALAVKTEENTELIKAHIAIVQQKVKPVKDGQEVLSWN